MKKGEKTKIMNKIYNSKLTSDQKYCFATIVSEWDIFIKLRNKYKNEGLISAVYKQLGIRFPYMYDINKPSDIIKLVDYLENN